MIDIITLEDALDQIATAVETRLVAAQAEGEVLENVATVVLGERSRPRPELPALYVFFDRLVPARTANISLREGWGLPLVIVSMVESEEPEDGYRLAMRYASRSRNVLLAGNRRLGLPFVNDTVVAAFDPSYQIEIDNRTVHAAALTLAVVFTVFDG